MSETAAEAALTAEIDAAVANNGGAPAPQAAPEPAPAPEAAETDDTATTDDAAPTEATEAGADTDKEPDKPTEPPYLRTRLAQMAREKGDAVRRADLAERTLAETRAAMEALKAGQSPDTTGLTQAQIREQAEQIATATLAARDQAARNDTFLKAGKEAFPDFDDRCNVVGSIAASIGEGKIGELMAIIGEMDDGAKVVAHLADHAPEAAAILAKPAHSMALALAKIGATLATPPATPVAKPISRAPKPITPVGGQTNGAFDPYDENLSLAEWNRGMDRMEKQRGKRLGA